MPLAVWLPIVVSIVALLSGGFGAYVGVRVALAGLQTWKDIRDGDIRSLVLDVGLLREDSAVHDLEMGYVMAHVGIPRVSRQRLRE